MRIKLAHAIGISVWTRGMHTTLATSMVTNSEPNGLKNEIYHVQIPSIDNNQERTDKGEENLDQWGDTVVVSVLPDNGFWSFGHEALYGMLCLLTDVDSTVALSNRWALKLPHTHLQVDIRRSSHGTEEKKSCSSGKRRRSFFCVRFTTPTFWSSQSLYADYSCFFPYVLANWCPFCFGKQQQYWACVNLSCCIRWTGRTTAKTLRLHISFFFRSLFWHRVAYANMVAGRQWRAAHSASLST